MKAVGLVGALLLGFSVFDATAAMLKCDGCTAIQRRSIARQAGKGTHYVVDLTNKIADKYFISLACAGDPTCPLDSELLSTEPTVKNYVAFVGTKRGTPVAIDANEFPDNAYEGVAYPQLSANVGNYIKEGGLGLVQDFINFLNAVNPISGFNPSAAQMTIRVNYQDGSTSLYTYDHTTQTWTRIKGWSRDSDGNIIPEAKEDASGSGPGTGGAGTTATYNFSTDSNLVNFLNQLAALGVRIVGTSDIRKPMVCVSDGSTTTCRFD